MNWFSKHVDTMIILGGILSSIIWMNGKFNEIEKEIYNMQKEIAVMKTVMIMKGIMPEVLSTTENKED